MFRRKRLKDEQWDLYFLSSEPSEQSDNDNTENENAENIFDTPCLVCASCELSIAGSEHILLEVVDHFAEAVFSYDLDVLNMNVQCYSATNPSTDRFDVIRLSEDLDFVVCSPKYTEAHSWFPGFAWASCACQGCGDFLGWRFRASDAWSPEFFGLIVTRLRPRFMAGLSARRVLRSSDQEPTEQGKDLE